MNLPRSGNLTLKKYNLRDPATELTTAQKRSQKSGKRGRDSACGCAVFRGSAAERVWPKHAGHLWEGGGAPQFVLCVTAAIVAVEEQ